ncbi:MAG: hypothetical protein ACRBBK_03805 [Paracoccaceae bacterium]
MTQAHDTCLEKQISFENAFKYQYVISRSAVDIPEFTQQELGKCHVYTGPSAHVSTLCDADGNVFGIVIGIAVDPRGLIEGRWSLPGIKLTDADFFDRFERYLLDVAGRYTMLIVAGEEERVYADPVGMNGVVYSTQTWRVAASPLLCLDAPGTLDPLFDHEVVESSGGKYSLFHTRFAEVRRMNPNFYLDMDNLHETRFWPRDETFATPDLEGQVAAYDEIIATTKHNIGAISEAFECALPITGGRDSRLMIAMAGDHAEKIDQIYSHKTNYATGRDAEVGKLICDELGLESEVHSFRDFKGTVRQNRLRWVREYQAAAGAPLNLPDEYRTGAIEGLKEGHVVLRGHQTDILRAVFMPYADKSHWKLFKWQIRKLLIVPGALFNADVYQRFLPDYQAWMRTLPRGALNKSIDFMFLEIYYTCGLGSVFPALNRNFYLSPYNSRRLIALSLSFDDQYRIEAKPVDDIVHRINPAVNAIPYDDDFGADLAELLDPEMREKAAQARVEGTVARAADFPPAKRPARAKSQAASKPSKTSAKPSAKAATKAKAPTKAKAKPKATAKTKAKTGAKSSARVSAA